MHNGVSFLQMLIYFLINSNYALKIKILSMFVIVIFQIELPWIKDRPTKNVFSIFVMPIFPFDQSLASVVILSLLYILKLMLF